MATFLHLEASTGWGGQEIRILREAIAMRDKGHTIFFGVQKGAILGEKALKVGFKVSYYDFRRRYFLFTLFRLFFYFIFRKIDIVVTHSSRDSWQGGIAAKLAKCTVIRTRHLSTPSKKGLNSYVLYNLLADKVITTCEEVAQSIRKKAFLSEERCCSIPTGVDPVVIDAKLHETTFTKPSPFVVGTACMLRSWKGLDTLVEAISLLKDEKDLSLLIIGDGPMLPHLKALGKKLGILDKIFFTGHLENPFPALATVDLFSLLSTANEGVSQASLQAAYLEKPLITTSTGGLAEIAVQGKTGIIVPPKSPKQVAEAILLLKNNPNLRQSFGTAAKSLLLSRFQWSHTLEALSSFYPL